MRRAVLQAFDLHALTYAASDRVLQRNRQKTDFRRLITRLHWHCDQCEQEMMMTKRNQTLKRGGPFAAGVLIGLSVVTPVFAATLDVETLQPLVLLASLIVLLIGLILKAMTERPSNRANARELHTPNPNDLRWRQTDPGADIAMPTHAMH
jgi:hypothetical protein